MSAINTLKGLAPGKIVYEVYGSLITANCTGNPENLISKCILTSFPKYWCDVINDRTDTLFVSYIKHVDEKLSYHSNFSVIDRGILESSNRTKKHNLNRIFWTVEDALDFIEQCKTGNFKDESDSVVKNNDMDLLDFAWEHDYEYDYHEESQY